MSEQDHLAGLRILENYQQNNRTREDRELITQMNRLKANDIIKGMEVDAEVKNFAKVSEFDAKDLDPNHPGYASQLMGIAKTRMRDLSPAAYEKARPMVAQFYDKFDARKQIEAEMDQRGTATDYTAMFGEAPAGISYQDSKFAMFAKDKFGVDPVFAEKDGIRIFDRKGTEAAVDVQRSIASETAGRNAGEALSAKIIAGLPGQQIADLDQRTRELSNQRVDAETKTAQANAQKNDLVQNVINDSSVFQTPFEVPKSLAQRATIMEFGTFQQHIAFPMKSDGTPDYREASKMVQAGKIERIKAEADAKRDPKEPVDPKLTGDEFNAAGFYKLMEDSDSIINGLPAGSQPGAGSSVLGSIPLVGGASSRSVQSPETQKFVQASQAWVRAKLRKESGAAIGKDEMAQEIATYFPQVGDKPDVIAQKAAMRLVATNNMKVSAGRALKGASGGSGSTRVENGVLYAPSKEAG
ncbi:MAG: hypothetical protein JHC85_10515, partial [Chthoniobacterales bacterium]|nr:hypothetical protein [Chthoniobacterales bacterium]